MITCELKHIFIQTINYDSISECQWYKYHMFQIVIYQCTMYRVVLFHLLTFAATYIH